MIEIRSVYNLFLWSNADLGSVKPQKRPGNACRLQALRDALRVIFRGKDKSHASCYRVSHTSLGVPNVFLIIINIIIFLSEGVHMYTFNFVPVSCS